MKLNRASAYALHAVAYLARMENQRPVASHIIAREQGVPERFLLKVLKPLVVAGLLLSVRGPNGGYRLARPANKISVLEVIEAAEGPIRGQAPSLGERPGTLDERLQGICDQAAEQLRKYLGKARITELIA